MTRRLFKGVAALAALCVSAPAMAEPANPDASRVAAAQKLLDAMHYDSLIDRTLEAVVAETQHSIAVNLNRELNEALPADLMTKIQAIAERHLRSAIGDHRAELKRGTALIYARHFSAEELSRLATLQSDPVMAKMQIELPQIAAETMALSRGLVDSAKAGIEDEMKAAVIDYMTKKGEKPST
jgi:hypothetical protein